MRDGKIVSPVRGASLIGKGDICNFVGIIILAGLTIVCFAQLALSLARRKQWLLCVIAILEVLVLVLAASAHTPLARHPGGRRALGRRITGRAVPAREVACFLQSKRISGICWKCRTPYRQRVTARCGAS